MTKEDAVAPPRAATTPPVPARTWRSICRCRATGWRWGARCCGSVGRRRCSATVAPVDIPSDGGGEDRTDAVAHTWKQRGDSGSISTGTGAAHKPSWGSSMFVLQLTGKFKRGNLIRRREKQQLQSKPKAAIGMLNELAALSSRDHVDELYVKELQCARQRRISLMFCDARFEKKYVDYHLDNWSLSALRERLLKFLGAFVFFAAFEDVLGSLRDPSLAQKLVAYAIVLAAFLGCYASNEALQWHEARSSTGDANMSRLRLPLHAGFSLVWSLMLMGMAIHFEEIRYLAALLMPLLYGHSVLHFHWLGCVYMLVAVVFEFVWVYVLDGWNSELDISTRAHSLHGVLIMSASLFMFVKYVCEQGSREHFRLVEVIELRKQQSIRGNVLAQKLIANILPPFIVLQLSDHPYLSGQHLRAGPRPRSDTSHVSYQPPETGQVIAHSYSSISVLFATVLVEPAENTTISRSSNKTQPTESAQLERVLLLDQVFSMFDRLLDLPTLPQGRTGSKETRDLTSSPLIRRVQPTNTTTYTTNSSMYEKIKTIGNTYMVAAGIPHDHECTSNGNVPALLQHAEAAIALSCKMQQAVASFNTAPEQATAQNGSQVLLRVGIHSGTVTAGVIGIKKYCFDIWGDTVNVASRMDATGIPGRIHMSATTRQMLSGNAITVDGTSVEFEARGLVDIKGKGPMETFLVAKTSTGQRQAKEPSLSCVGPSSTVIVASDSCASKNIDTVGQRVTSSSRLQVPLQPYSLAFGSSAAETVFQEEYAKNNLRVANSSVVLVILFLLVLVCLTGCWFWLRFLAAKLGGRYHAHNGSGSVIDDDDDNEREMQLAWLIVVGNTLIAVIMVVQLHCSACVHNMQRRLGIFSVVGILVIFAMNVSADLIGYSQLLETPYILSGLIYVFFLSKLLVVRAAPICWTWLLLHTVYRYSATGLHSLFYAQFGSPLFLCAMTMMLHVLASDNERKVRQGHWLRNMADAQSLRLLDARASSDALLENCLPKSVISDALRSAEVTSSSVAKSFNERSVEHRSFTVHREVTVLFVDIVNFTKLSAGMKPADLVSLLHDMVSQIDQLVERYPVEKIKTIGDAYMVASGLPDCRDDHAEAVAEFALDLLDIVSRFNASNQKAPRLNRPPIAVRAGIDTGPAIAGIIGDKKFCYDVWGAGVDGAIAMEQRGVANRIHVSQSTAGRLAGLYHMDLRDRAVATQPVETAAKAKLSEKPGAQTFFLNGRSKRVDFTGNSAGTARGSATWEYGSAGLRATRNKNRDQVSRAVSPSPGKKVEPRSRQPSVRVARERRQSSMW